MYSSHKNQSGFTLIELIVVIVILGILSVTAIPRYLDITEEAHIATTEGVTGAFRAGVLLANADYLVKHGSGEVAVLFEVEDENGSPLYVGANESGNPVSSDGSNITLSSDNDCSDLWNGLLNTSLIAGTNQLAPFASAPDVIASLQTNASGDDVDGVCNYLMSGAGVDMNLNYNSINGKVKLTRLN